MKEPYATKIQLFLLGAAMLVLTGVADARPSSFPTGTTIYNPEKAYNGYILFPGADRKTHLIDMDGNEVHRWDYESFPPQPLGTRYTSGKKGHVLVQKARLENPPPDAPPGGGMINAAIAEVDWDGNIVWQWGDQQHPAHQHHDIRRLDNGNTLLLTTARRRLDGFDYDVADNAVKIVDREGKIVWSWRASEHLAQLGFVGDRLQALKDTADIDFLHFNTAVPLGPNHWYDEGDERFAPDNIMVNSRNANVTAIIDKDSGDVVWRMGPDFPPIAFNGEVPRPVDQTVGLHDTHIIPEGLPGAGNLLLFDNQGNAGIPPVKSDFFSSSRVLEINPQTKQIVWQYNAIRSKRAPWSFYSAFISSAQRLPNGNTLIDEGQNGRLFQVTPEAEIVWEYVSPFFGKSRPADDYVTNQVYRAQLVDYDWAPAGTPHAEKPVRPDCAAYPAAPGCLPIDKAQSTHN